MFHPKEHPWRTDSGYGIAARYLVQGLYKDVDMAVFAPVGQRYKLEYYYPDIGVFGWEKEFEMVIGEESDPKNHWFTENVVPVYPGIGDDYGEDLVDQHYQHFQAEVLWQIADVWALKRIPDLAAQDRIKWVVQPPIDFLQPIPQQVIDKMKTAFKVVPWVKSGYDRLKDAGLDNLYDPIPLGLNCELWRPKDRTEHPGMMKSLGFGYDTFNISVVNANQYMRKAWEQTLRGIRIFREKHPDLKVRLYLHTYLSTAEGWDMQGLINALGLADITNCPNQYDMLTGQIVEFQLMMMHALADVVINASQEGFGYATVQAQAVGTPLIGLNEGATSDLTKKAILVPPYFDYMTLNFLHKTDPHPLHIADALEQVTNIPRKEFEENIPFIRENFAWDVVYGKWRKFFTEFDRELENRCIKSKRYPPAPSEREIELSKRRVEVA